MRVYLPTTLDRLAQQHADGAVVVPDDVVLADDDSEDAEYAALMAAAEDSADLVERTGRRVVVVADIDDVDAAVPMRDVVAVHADVDETGELAWFATQEIGALLETAEG